MSHIQDQNIESALVHENTKHQDCSGVHTSNWKEWTKNYNYVLGHEGPAGDTGRSVVRRGQGYHVVKEDSLFSIDAAFINVAVAGAIPFNVVKK